MPNVFPPSSYVDIPPKDSVKIRHTVQGTTAATMADVLLHQVEYRFLRSTTKVFQGSLFASDLRYVDPQGIVSVEEVNFEVSPRATQLWVWIDCTAGSATWEKVSVQPECGVTLWDKSTAALIDAGYSFRAIDGTLTEQFTGFGDAGLWDQRILFSGDRTDPGDGAPRRLDIPAAYMGSELYVRVSSTGVRFKSITVIEAYQPITPQGF